MKRKTVLIVALLAALAAVAAVVFRPRPLCTADAAPGGLAAARVLVENRAGRAYSESQTWTLQEDAPETGEILQLLSGARCRRTLGGVFGKHSYEGGGASLQLSFGSGTALISETGFCIRNGQLCRLVGGKDAAAELLGKLLPLLQAAQPEA